MKSILFATLLLVALSKKSFAYDVNVPKATLQNFETKFSNASNVQWSVVDQMNRAEFTIEGERKIAFFNIKDGSLVVTCRYLSITDLPKDIQENLKAEFANGKLTELYEVEDSNGVHYYATLKKEDVTIILKSDASKWHIYKKK